VLDAEENDIKDTSSEEKRLSATIVLAPVPWSAVEKAKSEDQG